MRENTLVITVGRPPLEVFWFALDPKNTPKWLDSVEYEETNEWPVKIGTTYRNRRQDGNWSEYVVSDFVEGEKFVLEQKDGRYRVSYTFRPAGQGSTELEYREWVVQGELEDPFTQDIFEKFKELIEKLG